MKKKQLLTIILALFIVPYMQAEGSISSDSTSHVKEKLYRFLSFSGTGGIVLPTNDYIRDRSCLAWYSSATLKFGNYSHGDRWEDFAYGMPYSGVGLYTAYFYDDRVFGTPVSAFIFHGGEIKRFNPKWSLNYEFNLGMSFNWKPYDAFDNPKNIAIGSASNVHVGANVYMNKKLNDRWGLNFGIGATHFSNGAQRLPNKGVNLVTPFVELIYNFDAQPIDYSKRYTLTPPPLEKRLDYDLLFTISSRQVWIDTLGTGLPERTIDKSFKVLGLSYATMFVNNYKFKWGPSLELVYDESSGIKVWRETHPDDGRIYDRVKMGPVYKRLSIGISVKGEMTFPGISFFANLGYNLLHGNKYDYRLYQIIGSKVYLKDNFFATFGIRASRFSKAQYLFWSLGYTIKGRPMKKDKYIQHILP